MASVTDARRKWTCPECRRTFKIPQSSADPDLCPACRIADDGVYNAEPMPLPPPRPPAPLPAHIEDDDEDTPEPFIPRYAPRVRRGDFSSGLVATLLTVIGGIALVVGTFIFGGLLISGRNHAGGAMIALVVVSPYLIGLFVLAVLGLGLGQIVKQLAER